MIPLPYASNAKTIEAIASYLDMDTRDQERNRIRHEASRLLREAARRLRALAGEEVPVVGQ